jgi:DNA mismatch repair protein MutL
MIDVASIRILEPAVADAIAAGEVVERPAAAVKELVENALDARASRIDVTVEGGGLTRIVVVDDGRGIPAAELRLAVARHGTSKLQTLDDLAAISSLGFRGEALASIAAVSELHLRSRTEGGDGAAIVLRGGQVVSETPAALAAGTAVEVRDLFAITPARLAFLRQPRSEAQACVRVVADAALARPDLRFTCTVDSRTVLRSTGGGLADAASSVLGRRAAAELLTVDAGGEIAVSGLISEPRAHRGDRTWLVVMVNGRRVHNRALVVAVEDAYRGLLPAGRHPYCVLDITCDPATVDVNVHPTKREIRFREERRVFSAVQRACWEALGDARLVGVFQPPAAAPMVTSAAEPGASSLQPALELADGPARPLHAPISQPARDDRLADLAPLRPLGQAGAGWIVADSPRGVVLVDPHAAHEKLLYTELLDAARAAANGVAPPSQLLLIDCIVDVGVAGLGDAEILQRMGFQIEDFGPGAVRVRAVPAAAAGVDCARLLVDATTDSDASAELRLHRIAALTACHAAVRLGDRLDMAEQTRLCERLPHVPGALTCPHGRPTVRVLDDDALRRMFHRPV